ncbi:MAG TPA: glycosyltransferase family 4 protein [Firmicutes bacterium]|nr:glycosyltransferase family 4 protein [Bacillota bacterium]
MRVLMLSWEYPPRVVGGLARHVQQLSRALVTAGLDVEVVTCGTPGAADMEDDRGVRIHRIAMNNPAPPDFLTWVMQLNLNMLEKAYENIVAGGPYDIVHAHDWLVAYAAKALKHSQRAPLVATIHATEWGRNWGLHNDLQRYISNVEWWLCFEAWRVICCSEYMRHELQTIFQLPGDKIRVLPNGVDPAEFQIKPDNDLASFRRSYAAPDEKLIFFVGRLVHEKGVHILIEAVPKILHYWNKSKVVIAGKGPADAYLKDRARSLGVYDRIYFTGYIDDDTRNRLYKCADVAVVPSLYEPFGITALEAMAAGTPVVVSDVGGLGEVVRHGITGWKSYAGNPNSLADGILHLIYRPDLAYKLKENAYREVTTRYSWSSIANGTTGLYDEIARSYQESPWARSRLWPQVYAEPPRLFGRGLDPAQRWVCKL